MISPRTPKSRSVCCSVGRVAVERLGRTVPESGSISRWLGQELERRELVVVPLPSTCGRARLATAAGAATGMPAGATSGRTGPALAASRRRGRPAQAPWSGGSSIASSATPRRPASSWSSLRALAVVDRPDGRRHARWRAAAARSAGCSRDGLRHADLGGARLRRGAGRGRWAAAARYPARRRGRATAASVTIMRAIRRMVGGRRKRGAGHNRL